MTIKLNQYVSATKSEIMTAENLLGVRLPADYRAFLMKFNAAIPEDNILDEDLGVSVERFIPVAEIATCAENVEGFPSDGVPIAEDGSGNFIYWKKGTTDVYFWDHEMEGDQKLASSFDEFLSALRPFDGGSVQLKPGQVKSVWIDPDFKAKFD